MRKFKVCIYIAFGLMAMLLLTGCFGKVDRAITNYYVLDYQSSSENPQMRRTQNTGKILEVLDTTLPKTYDRNQIVVKENFYKVRFLQTDVWANKLRNAIPNLISQRLASYNIFSGVSRSNQSDKNPNYYLETTVLNIEKVEDKIPQAYLRIEFVLKDSMDHKIVFSHKGQRYKELTDQSMVYLVQCFNDMLMEETNLFAAKCNQYFNGKLVPESNYGTYASNIDTYHFETTEASSDLVTWGELMVIAKTKTDEQLRFLIEGLDSLNNVILTTEGEFSKETPLRPGRYRVTLGELDDLTIPVVVKSRQRTVVKAAWGELQVLIFDETQTRVRLSYDLWQKNTDGQGYKFYSGGGISMGDDEIGAVDKLWILPPGHYLIKLGGGSWSDLRNFATVPLEAGERKILTIIADPTGETNLLIGAGVLADDDLGLGSKRWHKGAVHANLSLASNNNVDKNKPTTSVTLAAQFDNSIDIHDRIRPFHFTSRSIYDLGLNISSSNDFNFNLDDYSLKNVLLLYPMEKTAFFKNFAFYGRANVNTHCFDTTTFFSSNKNFILQDTEDNLVMRMVDQPSLKSKIAFYPMRLKEGTGITYRINYASNIWSSLRVGYGWQQDYNQFSYLYSHSADATFDDVTLTYDYYTEEADRSSKGIESTVILSAINLLRFLSINSTLDVLFPMGVADKTYLLENENRLNFRLFRNVSIDAKINIQYDKQQKPWVVYDYSSFLRLSLFY